MGVVSAAALVVMVLPSHRKWVFNGLFWSDQLWASETSPPYKVMRTLVQTVKILLTFSELWKITEDLPQSQQHLLMENGRISARTVSLVAFWTWLMPIRVISDLWSSTLWKNKFVSFRATQGVVVFHGNPRKLIHAWSSKNNTWHVRLHNLH